MKRIFNFITSSWQALNRFTEQHSQLTDMYAKVLSEAPPTHQPPMF